MQVTPAPTRPSGPRPSADLSSQQLQQLWQYLDYLLEVNKVMNLTGAAQAAAGCTLPAAAAMCLLHNHSKR